MLLDNINSPPPKTHISSPSRRPPSEKFYIKTLKEKIKKKPLPSLEDLVKEEKAQQTPSLPPKISSSNPYTSAPLDAQKISSCSVEIFSLLDKLSSALILEKQKGISTTTLVMNDPSNALQGCEVEIKHYDIAPHSFHLSITAPEHLHQDIKHNIHFLNQRLSFILPDCKFYFAPPQYKSLSSASIDKRSSADKKKLPPIQKNHGLNH